MEIAFNPCPEDKHRIMINQPNSYGFSASPRDFENLEELKKYLTTEGVIRVSLKFRSYFDDVADWRQSYDNGNDITEEDFEWLHGKGNSESRFLEIDSRK